VELLGQIEVFRDARRRPSSAERSATRAAPFRNAALVVSRAAARWFCSERTMERIKSMCSTSCATLADRGKDWNP
jgi:hypothetical protein